MKKWLILAAGAVAALSMIIAVTDRMPSSNGLSARDLRIVETGIQEQVPGSGLIKFHNFGTVETSGAFKLVCGEFDGRSAFGPAAGSVAFMGTIDGNQGRFVAVKLGIASSDRIGMLSNCDGRGVIRHGTVFP